MFKIGFLGRGQLGLDIFKGLLANPAINVPIAITCGATPEVADTASEVERLANSHGIEYFHTNVINRLEYRDALARHDLDLAVAMLWLHTINDEVIATARHGFLNLHGGHLPKYRGNACANWAILNNEPFIGTTVHLMAPGDLDSGPVILRDRVALDDDSYVSDVIAELETKGKKLVFDAVELIRRGEAEPEIQNPADASFCYPRIPRDGEIDWTQDAARIHRLIRSAGKPYPGAYSYYSDVRADGEIRKLTIWRAHIERHPLPEYYSVPGHVLRLAGGEARGIVCGDGQLLILEDIERDGTPIAPPDAFKTVRQRMGLDRSAQLADLSRRIARLESGDDIEGFGEQYARRQLKLDTLGSEVAAIIANAASQLNAEAIRVEPNPLRDYSFQRRYYDWEKRERWFGIQIYRSLRPTDIVDEPFAVGYWNFSEVDRLEHRVFVAVKPDLASRYGATIGELFTQYGDDVITQRTAEGHIGGCYICVDDNHGVGDVIVGLCRKLVAALK